MKKNKNELIKTVAWIMAIMIAGVIKLDAQEGCTGDQQGHSTTLSNPGDVGAACTVTNGVLDANLSSCRQFVSYDPAPPTYVYDCINQTYVTNLKCEPYTVNVTKKYLEGVPHWGKKGTDTMPTCYCTDWATTPSDENVGFNDSDLERC